MYHYRAVIRRWVDGDTVEMDVDLGLHVWKHTEDMRLIGINAPDKNPAKKAATAYVNQMAPAGAKVTIQTYLDDDEDRYGRLLVDIDLADGTNLNDAIVDAGHGQVYDGGARPSDY